MSAERDVLRDVAVDEYRLTTWDTHRNDRRGQSYLGYTLAGPDGAAIFEGDDFTGSPMHADDSDDTLRALLNFLTLKPGDTDRDYFDSYTAAQMAFAQGDAERISLYCCDPDEGFESYEFPDWTPAPQRSTQGGV